ncbi:hypothetical protein AGLY_012539 [Aphis glycines]|uniref:Uncharacterized protein n=1 Tax=Aphis glycines TaxID=307491 RepID=A0A6G0T8N7_APHGL|nr:hypothetical protein AGLY_012539 [Aphis glycines]
MIYGWAAVLRAPENFPGEIAGIRLHIRNLQFITDTFILLRATQNKRPSFLAYFYNRGGVTVIAIVLRYLLVKRPYQILLAEHSLRRRQKSSCKCHIKNYKIHTLKLTCVFCILFFLFLILLILYEESVRFLCIICSTFLKPECYKNDEFDKYKNPSMILPNNNIEIGHDTINILISCKNEANYNKFMNI